MKTDDAINELVTRMRRVETRLTAYMVSQGVEINAHPKWVPTEDDEGYVEVPALTASLSACLAVVPANYNWHEVEVVYKGKHLAWLDLDGLPV